MFRALRRIHNDERGLETLQVVMIIAVAAIILAFIKLFWTNIVGWFHKVSDWISGWNFAQ
jgi:hypothetical protein